MRATRHQAIATLVAFALATGSMAPVAFAKSSGFSSSRSSSSSSSSSRSSSGSSSSRYSSSSSSSSSSSGASYGRSYSSSSYKSSSYGSSARSPAKTSSTSSTSGFSSSGSRKVIAATALGGALYAAQSSHDAAATLNSSQSSRSGADGSSSLDRDTSGNTRSYGTRSDASPSPSYSAPARSAPPPVVAPQSSGNNGLLLGYMLGRSSSPRETVVVQQPARAVDSAAAPMYRHVSSGNATPDTSTAASDVQAETVDQPRAMTAKQATKESKHPFLDAIVLTVMLACSVYLVVALCKRVRRAWLVRKARYASHTNYRL